MENRGAAGLRRSAIAERLRLREEWSALKEINEEPITTSQKNVLTKKHQNTNSGKRILPERTKSKSKRIPDKENSQVSSQVAVTSDVLRGVVVLVDVGAESRALALRAALAALGATVAPAWSPLVTHLVWSEGGCRGVRARARALACHVVSPLWVEGCAGGRRLPERLFPAPPRASDLPSPAALKRMLIRADRENVSLADLLSDSPETTKRLRMSDETSSRDTSRDTSKDTSRDTSRNTSREERGDKSRDTPGSAVRVNTAPRRALPLSTSPQPPARSRRKLFTNREPDGTRDQDTDEDRSPAPEQRPGGRMSPRARRDLAAAERMARRLVTRAARTPPADRRLRMVVTGMSRTERRIITKAIKHLNGVVQGTVDKTTDCVVLGSCSAQCPEDLLAHMFAQQLNIDEENHRMNVSGVCDINMARCRVRTDLMPNGETFKKPLCENNEAESNKRSGLTQSECGNRGARAELTPMSAVVQNLTQSGAVSPEKPRTVNALLGAVRGCRVVRAAWVMESVRQGRWIHHVGYEVRHLMKISQKARVERSALGRMKREYAYNLFRGMSVHVTRDADQRDAVLQLLTMCGAALTDKPCARQNGGITQNGATQNAAKNGPVTLHYGVTQNGGLTQNGGTQNGAAQKAAKNGPVTLHYGVSQNGGLTQNGAAQNAAKNGPVTLHYGVTQNGGLTQNGGIQDGADIAIGVKRGEICSRWVFDSVAASRMRTTRRYVND